MSKFSVLKILSEELIESGAWLHLLSPTDDEPLYRDPPDNTKPCRVLVRSAASKVHKAAEFKANSTGAAKINRAKAADKEKVREESVNERIYLQFRCAIVAMDNCIDDKSGIVEISDEDALAMHADPSMEWMVLQVVAFSQQQSNYGPQKDPNGDAGAVKAAGAKTKA